MQKLVQGVHRFHDTIFPSRRDLFERLAHEQRPEVLFITCSDSRIDPNLVTQTEPGDLFIVRNAGNIVPPYGTTNGGEGASIEFAVAGLGVSDIVICGHSHCGAMKGLLDPQSLAQMPTVAAWLAHAEAARWIVRQKYAGRSHEALVNVTIQENVLVQVENLCTHPAVAAGLAAGKLKLHAWVYKIETGQVFAYDPRKGQFLPVAYQLPPAIPPLARLTTDHTI